MWTRQHNIETGRAAYYIGRCTGHAFPEQEMRAIEEALAARGLSLLQTLRKVRAHENALVVGQYTRLPQAIVDELDSIAAVPGMETL